MVFNTAPMIVFRVTGQQIWLQRIDDQARVLFYTDSLNQAQKFTISEAEAW